MKTTVFIALFIAIIGRLMADEVKAWAGWLHKRIRRNAVAKLPLRIRERYDEEWEGGLEETPGEIFKVIYSLGLLRASARICAAQTGALRRGTLVLLCLKRALDTAFSLAAMVLLAPVLLAIAFAIKLDSHGPALYASERIGKNGRVFRCFKFRTMVRDAGRRQAEIMHMSERRGVPSKIPNHPRITPLGRFLRKYSLDELPQFFNVLKGDMSIVGPRPPLASEMRHYKLNELRQRLDVTPGITGLWQVQGSQDDPSFDSMISLDVTYIKNWSVWLDIKIILRTVFVVFAGTWVPNWLKVPSESVRNHDIQSRSSDSTGGVEGDGV